MKRIFIAMALLSLALATHFSLFEWKVGNAHYSMYMSSVRDLHPEEKNKQLFVQLGESTYSSEQRYAGYKRGYGVFFRDFIATPQLQTIAILFGIVGSFSLILGALYVFLFKSRENA